MKYPTRFCETGASSMMTSFKPIGGRSIPRQSHHPRTNAATGENAEMEMYLSKLQNLVPFIPKNRKVSKLEIIEHVIDYICELQTELETHPEINNFNESAALNFTVTDNDKCDNNRMKNDQQDEEQEEDMIQSNPLTVNEQMMEINSSRTEIQQRQPLMDRQAPNTILPSVSGQAAITTTTTHNHYEIKHW